MNIKMKKNLIEVVFLQGFNYHGLYIFFENKNKKRTPNESISSDLG